MLNRRLLYAMLVSPGVFALATAMPTFGQTVSSGNGATCGSGSSFMQCGILPVAGGTYAYPVQVAVIATTPNTITAWKVYVDGTEVQPDDNGNDIDGTTGGTTGVFDTTISAAGTGTHTIGVNTWADNGQDVLVYQVQVTIVSSPMPTPGSGAMLYSNLQSESGKWGSWSDCVAQSCSGSDGSGSGSITLNATVNDSTSPESLSGSTLLETSNGSEVNTLGWRPLGCPSQGCTGVSNFVDDLWFYIPSSDSKIQALEFDPDVFTGTQGYKMSMQCDSASGDWRFWNSKTDQWTVDNEEGGTITTYPCSLLTKTNTWHHFQLYGTMDFSSGTYTYQTFVVDGTTVFQNLGNDYYEGPPPGSTETLNVQQQIDNASGASSNSVYYDNYNLTVW
jgi:hypothetical protein